MGKIKLHTIALIILLCFSLSLNIYFLSQNQKLLQNQKNTAKVELTSSDYSDFYSYYNLKWYSMWNDNFDNDKLKYTVIVSISENIDNINEMLIQTSDLAQQYVEKSESSHEVINGTLKMSYVLFFKDTMPYEIREDVYNNFNTLITLNDKSEISILDVSVIHNLNKKNNEWSTI